MDRGTLRIVWCRHEPDSDKDDYDENDHDNGGGGLGGTDGFDDSVLPQHAANTWLPNARATISMPNESPPAANLGPPRALKFADTQFTPPRPSNSGQSPIAVMPYAKSRSVMKVVTAARRSPRKIWGSVNQNFLPVHALNYDDVRRDGVVPTVVRCAIESIVASTGSAGSARSPRAAPTLGSSHAGSSSSELMEASFAGMRQAFATPALLQVLRVLDLHGCGIGDIGLDALFSAFRTHKAAFGFLETLSLVFNGITDRGAALIGDLIKTVDSEWVAERQRRVAVETTKLMSRLSTQPATRAPVQPSPTRGWKAAKAIMSASVRHAIAPELPAPSTPVRTAMGSSLDDTSAFGNVTAIALTFINLRDNDVTDKGAKDLLVVLVQANTVQMNVELAGNDVAAESIEDLANQRARVHRRGPLI